MPLLQKLSSLVNSHSETLAYMVIVILYSCISPLFLCKALLEIFNFQAIVLSL